MATHKDAILALELMNVVLQQEQQMRVSYVLMIPSSKMEDLKTETTSAVESIAKNMATKVMDNPNPFLQIVLHRALIQHRVSRIIGSYTKSRALQRTR